MLHFPLIALTAFSVLQSACAQRSVPSDLSSDFDPSSIELQVSFDGQSGEGFKDGTEFTSQGKLRRVVEPIDWSRPGLKLW